MRTSLKLAASAAALTLTALTSLPALAASDTMSGSPMGPVVDDVILFDTVEITPVDLASNLMGNTLYGKEDKKIGKISDLVIDGSERVVALKVGVGGFLGIDETYVAVPMSDVTLSREGQKLRVASDLTKKQVQAAVGE